MVFFTRLPRAESHLRSIPESAPHSWSGVSAHGNSHVHNGNNTQNASDFIYRVSTNNDSRIDGHYSTNHISNAYNITNIIGCGFCLGAPGQPGPNPHVSFPQCQPFRPQGSQYQSARRFGSHLQHPIPPDLPDRRPPQYSPSFCISVPQTRQNQVWPSRHIQPPRERSRAFLDREEEPEDDSACCKWLCGSLLCFLLQRLRLWPVPRLKDYKFPREYNCSDILYSNRSGMETRPVRPHTFFENLLSAFLVVEGVMEQER